MFSSSSSNITISTIPTKSPKFPRKIVASCTSQNRASSVFPKMASSVSLYEVLGISMGASCNEIKAAYRKLARTCHPDVVAMNQKESSANEFMKIHSAYSTLSDPSKRAQYDREIYYGHNINRSLNSVNVGSMYGYQNHRYAQSRMKWETDQCW